ncbi:hypothetical protein KXV52_007213, partial [Aspergillus fumigatus]
SNLADAVCIWTTIELAACCRPAWSLSTARPGVATREDPSKGCAVVMVSPELAAMFSHRGPEATTQHGVERNAGLQALAPSAAPLAN